MGIVPAVSALCALLLPLSVRAGAVIQRWCCTEAWTVRREGRHATFRLRCLCCCPGLCLTRQCSGWRVLPDVETIIFRT